MQAVFPEEAGMHDMLYPWKAPSSIDCHLLDVMPTWKIDAPVCQRARTSAAYPDVMGSEHY